MSPRERQSDTSSRFRPLLPLVLATMASQALLVVLAPTIVEVGNDLGASVGAVGQSRSTLAGAAIAASLILAPFLDRIGVRPLLLWGASLAVAGSAAAALSSSLAAFLSVHALIGVGFACLLSAGFAGVAAFPAEDRPWTMGYVVGANALAWIVVNPIAGALTEILSWRAAHAVPAAIALCVLASARAAPGGSATSAPGRGLGGVLADTSARRWLLAEMIAFFAWGTWLTFVGAFFIQSHGLGESSAGVLLALGAAAFLLASVRCAPLADHFPQQRLAAVSALALGAFAAVQFNASAILWVALAAFFVSAVAGGVRTSVSSALGLAQLPDQPGSMMAARTAATMMGYLLGGLVGGATLAYSGYGALGVVLGAAMVLAATLVIRVSAPESEERSMASHMASQRAAASSAAANHPPASPVETKGGRTKPAGEWAYDVGILAKSGVSSGLLVAVPSYFGGAFFSPGLDRHGNSVRGVNMCRDLSTRFGLHAYADPREAVFGRMEAVGPPSSIFSTSS